MPVESLDAVVERAGSRPGRDADVQRGGRVHRWDSDRLPGGRLPQFAAASGDYLMADGSPSEAPPSMLQTAPSCPICTSATIHYGRQGYPVPGGILSSWIHRCEACDFNFRRFDRPRPEVVKHFLVAPYSNITFEERWLRSRAGFYRYLLGLLGKPAKDGALLDVGCAFGHFLNCAAEVGYEPFGVEVSEAMAELTRSRCPYPVSVRPIHDLQLPRDLFDAITFVDSFYYFEDPLSTLRQARRLLRRGGRLLIRVTNRNTRARLYHALGAVVQTFQSVTARLENRSHRRDAPDIPFWTTDDAISCHSRRSLSLLMARTGFRIIKLTGLERGKRITPGVSRNIDRITHAVCRLTRERVCYTSGLVCLATPA